MTTVVTTAVRYLLEVARGSVKIFQPAKPADCEAKSDDELNAPTFRTRSHARTFGSLLLPLIFSSAVGAKLPNDKAWSRAYQDNPECKLIMDMIANPSLIMKKNLQKLNSAYRDPLRRGLVLLERGFLCSRSRLGTSSFIRS